MFDGRAALAGGKPGGRHRPTLSGSDRGLDAATGVGPPAQQKNLGTPATLSNGLGHSRRTHARRAEGPSPQSQKSLNWKTGANGLRLPSSLAFATKSNTKKQ